MKRRDIVLAILAAALMTGTGCSDGKTDRGEEIEYLPVETERYENHIEIEGQWGSSAATGPEGEYGIGDPFVMRYNGKYYLYPSTSDPCDGIKVFESEDLIHWTYKGLAVAETEATSHGAYAPEVIYYTVGFICVSPAAERGIISIAPKVRRKALSCSANRITEIPGISITAISEWE